jgi:hypothetical protein
MYLENCIYEDNPKTLKRLEIGKDIRGVISKEVMNQKIETTKTTHSVERLIEKSSMRENCQFLTL